MERIIWKFQCWENFGFLIPKDRDYYGGDFYVSKKHFGWAKDWDMVEGVEVKTSWKKPEAVILGVLWKKKNEKNEEYVEWIFCVWDWDFWFVDVEWREKWYFVFWKNSLWAKDWDKVKAKINEYKWKEEATIVKIFNSQFVTTEWIFKDNENYWFVVTKTEGDIFIPWFKKNWAKEWSKVEVKIVKEWKKNKEWIIIKILE